MQHDEETVRKIPVQIETRSSRRRPRSSSGLIISFLFGLAIGFSVGIGFDNALRGVSEETVEPAEGSVRGVELTPPVARPPVDTTERASAPAPTDGAASVATTEATAAEASVSSGGPSSSTEPTAVVPPQVWPGRFLFVSVAGPQLDDATRALLREVKPGGVVLLGANIQSKSQTAELVKSIKEATGLGTGVADLPLIAVDQEGGPVNRLNLENAPSPEDLGRRANPEEARRVGKHYADACLARGIGLLLGPSLDTAGPNTPSEMRARCIGDDNRLVTAMGLALALGITEGGVAPIIKHYPGMGGIAADPHKAAVSLRTDVMGVARAMYPFSEAIARGVPGVMAGHVAVPALDTKNPERPASVSSRLITDVLRNAPLWKYDGVVLADDVAMKSMTETGRTPERAAVEALTAGCDAVILCDPKAETVRSVCAAIEQTLVAYPAPKAALERSARRLDALSAWLRSPVPLSDSPLPVPPELSAGNPSPAPVAESPATSPAPPVETVAATPTAPPVEAVSPAEFSVPPAPPVETSVPVVEQTAPTPEPSAQTTIAEPQETTPQPPVATAVKTPATPPPGTKLVKRTVKQGDTLTAIAREYGVKVKDIKEWNAIEGETIVWGRTLKVYVKDDGSSSAAETQVTPEASAPAGPPPNSEKVTHVVVKGETLSGIAAQYGVRQKDIVAWNKLTGETVKYDTKLTIYRPVVSVPEPEPAPPASTPEAAPTQ